MSFFVIIMDISVASPIINRFGACEPWPPSLEQLSYNHHWPTSIIKKTLGFSLGSIERLEAQKINTLKLSYKCVLHILLFSKELMWVSISIYGTFVGSLQEDFRKDPGSWTHIISTLTRKSEWSTPIISTLILHPHIRYRTIWCNCINVWYLGGLVSWNNSDVSNSSITHDNTSQCVSFWKVFIRLRIRWWCDARPRWFSKILWGCWLPLWVPCALIGGSHKVVLGWVSM